MDLELARRTLNATLRDGGVRAATDVEFARAVQGFAADYETGEEEDFAERAADYILFGRDVAEEPRAKGEREVQPVSLEPPEWWSMAWQRRVDFWAPRKFRIDLRRKFGLGRRCESNREMLAVLRKARAEQTQIGPTLKLPVWPFRGVEPEAADVLEDYWEVWRGQEGHQSPGSHQPLYAVAATLDELQEECGAAATHSLRLLFMDEPVPARWLDVDSEPVWREGAGPDPDLTQFRITVWSPMVSTKAITGAYSEARRRIFGETQDRRAPRLWPYRAAIFKEAWDASGAPGGWQAAFDAFRERYPNQEYKNMRTFRNAIYERRRSSDAE
jgi:hypothetical protein